MFEIFLIVIKLLRKEYCIGNGSIFQISIVYILIDFCNKSSFELFSDPMQFSGLR